MTLYARVTTSKGDPGKLDDTIAYVNERVVPALEQASGLVGVRLLVDRETGVESAITFWESVSAMNAADQLAQHLREQAVQSTGFEVVDVDRSEILIFDSAAESVVPLYTRRVQIYAQPEKVDALVNFIKSEGAAQIRGYKGFRSLVLAVNRVTGGCTISIAFESAEARDATEQAGAASRAKAAEIAGAPEATVARREMVVAHVRAGLSA